MLTPLAKHSSLLTDDNNPARVWREGRAKAAGFDIYQEGEPGVLPKRPKGTKRKGIPANLEWTSWTPIGKMIYPPPASEDVLPRRPRLGLASFAAANPEDPQTLPRLHVRRELTGDYNSLQLAKRVFLYRVYALMGCSPEWSQVSPNGNRGTRYKINPWAHDTVSHSGVVPMGDR